MLTTVKLLGELGRTFGREYQFDINSPSDAIKALAANFPDFITYLQNSDNNNLGYRLLTGDYELSEDELTQPIPYDRPLIIAPVIMGSGAIGRIITGTVLLGLAFLVPGGILGIGAVNLGLIGGSLILGGVAQLLAGTPETNNRDNFNFNGAVNTTQQGICVPLAYGKFLTGSVVISSRITTQNLSLNYVLPNSTTPQ
jgi:predicted phage tail protein